MRTNLPRAVRALRLQRGWSQAALAERAGVSREIVSRIERDDLGRMSPSNVERVATALGAIVYLNLRWRGEELDRLLDAAHAALQQSVSDDLERAGWTVRVEVSFNHYGERGRVDILAFHRGGCLLVVEIKSALGDLQDTIGRLDIKARIGRELAKAASWPSVSAVIPCLVIADTARARDAVKTHPALFARFDVRGRYALAWLARPVAPAPSGLLWFANSHVVTNRRRLRASKAANSHRL